MSTYEKSGNPTEAELGSMHPDDDCTMYGTHNLCTAVVTSVGPRNYKTMPAVDVFGTKHFAGKQVVCFSGFADAESRKLLAFLVAICLGNATVRGRAWYKLLDAPVLTLDVTVWKQVVCFSGFADAASRK